MDESLGYPDGCIDCQDCTAWYQNDRQCPFHKVGEDHSDTTR